jgi:hypothetical protein
LRLGWFAWTSPVGRSVRACGDAVGAGDRFLRGRRTIVVNKRKRWNHVNELPIHKMIADPDSIQILSISNKHFEGNGDFSCW